MVRFNRLMAVDGEADITLTLKIVLEQKSFLVDVFNDPETALIKFKPHFYDLLLIDVNMPHLNGFELYQEIKTKDRYAKEESCCFIRKPIDIDYLVNKIMKALIEFK